MTVITLFHGFPFLSLHNASKMPHYETILTKKAFGFPQVSFPLPCMVLKNKGSHHNSMCYNVTGPFDLNIIQLQMTLHKAKLLHNLVRTPVP